MRARAASELVATSRVPELTRGAYIKLNARVSLQLNANAIPSSHRTLPHRPDLAWQSRQAIILRLAALFFRSILEPFWRRPDEHSTGSWQPFLDRQRS
jgi:hypothetical protein